MFLLMLPPSPRRVRPAAAAPPACRARVAGEVGATLREGLLALLKEVEKNKLDVSVRVCVCVCMPRHCACWHACLFTKCVTTTA